MFYAYTAFTAIVGQSLFKYFLHFMLLHVGRQASKEASTTRVVESSKINRYWTNSTDWLTIHFLLCWFGIHLSLFFLFLLNRSSTRTHQYTWWIKHGAKQCRGTIQRGQHNEAEVRRVWRPADAKRHVAARRSSGLERDLLGAQRPQPTEWNCSRAFK